MDLHEQLFYDYQTKARGLLTESTLRQHFEKHFSYYDLLLSEYLPKQKDATILDIPCGFGNSLYYLKLKGYSNITGYDLDEKQVSLARLLDLPAHQGNACDILKKEASVDMILSIDFLEHISKDQACRFLMDCYRILNTGGVLIIRVPSADGPFGTGHAWNDITHKWYLTSNAWKRGVLRMIGFKEENIMIKQDLVIPSKCLKKIKYKFAEKVFHIWCDWMGIAPPKIMSRSMWVICRK